MPVQLQLLFSHPEPTAIHQLPEGDNSTTCYPGFYTFRLIPAAVWNDR